MEKKKREGLLVSGLALWGRDGGCDAWWWYNGGDTSSDVPVVVWKKGMGSE
ncbi:hypothetical protein BVRB_9g215330 [Beta vulgaris subsp. vulgaris]|nr:hypothetical protein BVRB_9g215330 [Beta vulgaris subsp. vulgaris]